MELKTEGIILKTFPFQDHDLLLTVFTEKEGLAKFILKGTNKKNAGISTAPLTVAEFIFTRGRSDLLKCNELSVIQQHLSLRQSLKSIQAAGEMSQAIIKTKIPFQQDLDAYKLFSSYLRNLVRVIDPFFLSSSFYLKMLIHEGLTPNFEKIFSGQELFLIFKLLSFKTYSEISQDKVEEDIREKIKNLFNELIE